MRSVLDPKVGETLSRRRPCSSGAANVERVVVPPILHGKGGESGRRENFQQADHDLSEFRTQSDPNREKRGEIMSKTRISIWGTTTKSTLALLSVLFLSAAPTVFASPRPNDSDEVMKLMSEVKSEAVQL